MSITKKIQRLQKTIKFPRVYSSWERNIFPRSDSNLKNFPQTKSEPFLYFTLGRNTNILHKQQIHLKNAKKGLQAEIFIPKSVRQDYWSWSWHLFMSLSQSWSWFPQNFLVSMTLPHVWVLTLTSSKFLSLVEFQSQHPKNSEALIRTVWHPSKVRVSLL